MRYLFITKLFGPLQFLAWFFTPIGAVNLYTDPEEALAECMAPKSDKPWKKGLNKEARRAVKVIEGMEALRRKVTKNDELRSLWSGDSSSKRQRTEFKDMQQFAKEIFAKMSCSEADCPRTMCSGADCPRRGQTRTKSTASSFKQRHYMTKATQLFRDSGFGKVSSIAEDGLCSALSAQWIHHQMCKQGVTNYEQVFQQDCTGFHLIELVRYQMLGVYALQVDASAEDDEESLWNTQSDILQTAIGCGANRYICIGVDVQCRDARSDQHFCTPSFVNPEGLFDETVTVSSPGVCIQSAKDDVMAKVDDYILNCEENPGKTYPKPAIPWSDAVRDKFKAVMKTSTELSMHIGFEYLPRRIGCDASHAVALFLSTDKKKLAFFDPNTGVIEFGDGTTNVIDHPQDRPIYDIFFKFFEKYIRQAYSKHVYDWKIDVYHK